MPGWREKKNKKSESVSTTTSSYATGSTLLTELLHTPSASHFILSFMKLQILTDYIKIKLCDFGSSKLQAFNLNVTALKNIHKLM
jgi:hypothetical protein